MWDEGLRVDRRRSLTPGLTMAVAVAIGSAGIGCGSKKPSEVELAAPAYAAIVRQLKETPVETDAQRVGGTWTKARLEPKKVAAQVMRPRSKSEPFRLLMNIDYRVRLLSQGAGTEEAAQQAVYDSTVDMQVIAELVWQENRWYLDKLMLPDTLNARNSPPIQPALAKAIERLL